MIGTIAIVPNTDFQLFVPYGPLTAPIPGSLMRNLRFLLLLLLISNSSKTLPTSRRSCLLVLCLVDLPNATIKACRAFLVYFALSMAILKKGNIHVSRDTRAESKAQQLVQLVGFNATRTHLALVSRRAALS
jgi:hypothetical protein